MFSIEFTNVFVKRFCIKVLKIMLQFVHLVQSWRCLEVPQALAVWWCGGVAVWQCSGVAVWQCGGVAVWQCGGVVVWRYSGVAV